MAINRRQHNDTAHNNHHSVFICGITIENSTGFLEIIITVNIAVIMNTKKNKGLFFLQVLHHHITTATPHSSPFTPTSASMTSFFKEITHKKIQHLWKKGRSE